MHDFIIHPDENAGKAMIGGKARNLLQLSALGQVPPWFVIPAGVFEQYFSATAMDGAETARAVNTSSMPLQMSADLVRAAREVAGHEGLLAVRSSGADEDGEHYSFAGQFVSLLNVKPEAVPAAALAVWRSGFSPSVADYRRTHGLRPARGLAVIVQRMVIAEKAGVAFGADPVSGNRSCFVISAVRGVAADLVAGKETGQTFRTGIDGAVLDKDVADGEKNLSARDLREIARMLRVVNQHFGCPQDMEWAIRRGTLYLLQSRPITALAGPPPGILWDNSNLVESYSGVTMPLTFSFACYLYQQVYRQMARALGVDSALIERNAAAFRNLIGIVRGRMYYNVLNWYRCLSLLPGFALNRRLMEQMMGVDRSVPDNLLARLRQERAATEGGRVVDSFRILKMIGMMAVRRLSHSRDVRRFHLRIDRLLGRSRQEISGASLEELAALYRFLEKELINKWSVPLINDLFCMLSFGLLKRALSGWAKDEDGSLCNALLVDRGGIISAVPARSIAGMSRYVAEQPLIGTLIREGRIDEALSRIHACPELSRLFESYLDRFGDRCLGELKLESPCLREDPAPLLHAMAAAGDVTIDSLAVISQKRYADQVLRDRLKGRPVRRVVARALLAEARARIRDRENMRFERTRVFGHARRIFIEMGRRLEETGHLKTSRDVFYLTMEEIFGFLDGTIACPSLIELVTVRKRSFDAFRRQPPLPRRFETRGPAGMERVHAIPASPGGRPPKELPDAQRCGLGCAPGVVEGPVRIVTEPHSTSLSAGEILVAEFTDPGWVTLMAQASGMIIERGSLLSHSAIVARELGIPTIVAVDGATSWLRDGDRVCLDGATGVIRRCAPDGEAEAAA